MTNLEKRSILRVGFISLFPRKIWRREEYLAVALVFTVGVGAELSTWATGTKLLNDVTLSDQSVTTQRADIAKRVAPLLVMQTRLNAEATTSAALLAQRRSGLVLAQKIIAYGDAIGHDGSATLLDTAGHIIGNAPNFPAISRIWSRLGENVILTSARPNVSGISFSFQSTSGTTSTVAPQASPVAPVIPGGAGNSAVPSNPTAPAGKS
jgi:hypothetical protein